MVEEGRVGSLFHRVPGAPFIDNQPDFTARVPHIQRRALLDDQVFHLEPFFEKAVKFFHGIFGCSTGCAAVIVRGKAVYVVKDPVIFVELAEKAVSPFHVVARRAAGDHEQLFPKATNKGSITAKFRTVIFRGKVAATAPVLISHPPIRHVQRFRAAVCRATLRPGGTVGTRMGKIAVFDPIAQLTGRAGADVPTKIRFSANQATEADKFLSANMIVLDHFAPVDIDPARALVTRANAILPVIIVSEAAARPANDRRFQAAQSLYDICAEATHIRDGRILTDPDAIINAPTEVLGKVPIDIGVDCGDGIRRVEGDTGRCHSNILVSLCVRNQMGVFHSSWTAGFDAVLRGRAPRIIAIKVALDHP